MHAELCPVCNGTGRYQGIAQCHGCDGDGWVEVGNNPEYVPYPYDCDYPNVTIRPFIQYYNPQYW